MRISEWSSDVCSSDLLFQSRGGGAALEGRHRLLDGQLHGCRRQDAGAVLHAVRRVDAAADRQGGNGRQRRTTGAGDPGRLAVRDRKSVVEGKRVSVRVGLGGGRCSKKKKKKSRR